jgi:hypothetical protein
MSLPSYRLQYEPNGPRLFIVLCQKHLQKRLSGNPPASILEKRSTWPANEPCADCVAAGKRAR